MPHRNLSRPGARRVPAIPDTKDESCVAFDANAEAWDAYANTPLGRLRQELALHFLSLHLVALPAPADVLDAGGGTGASALALAASGHRVCLLDFSPRMLSIARARFEAADQGAAQRIELICAPVERMADLFPAPRFDLVLCHTLLEYVPEPLRLLGDLAAVLRPGGWLSALCANAHGVPLRWALVQRDLERARSALHEHVSSTDLFGLPRKTFTPQALRDALCQVGLEPVASYGVRTFADYLPAEEVARPELYDRLVALERAAGPLAPYREVARYCQVVARRPQMADGERRTPPQHRRQEEHR